MFMWCQCDRVEHDRLSRLEDVSNLPPVSQWRSAKTLANFNRRPGTETAFSALEAFSSRTGPPVLVLVGQTGSGKSHMAEGMARQLLAENTLVRYEFVPDLLDRLKATFDSNSDVPTEAVLDQVRLPSVLVLDDVGTEAPSVFTADRLTTIVDERIRTGRRLLVATNKTHEGMKALSNGVYFRLASRLWDQHSGAVRTVSLTCGDYRLEGAKQEVPA